MKTSKQFKEKHCRLPKDQIDITQYKPLINKVLHRLARIHGQYVFEMEEELVQDAYVGLLTAKRDYNPERGTFVTLAWLRIDTFMVRRLNKASREYVKMNHLEDLKFPSDSGDKLTWQDMFPSNQIDFGVVARLSAKDNLDWKILEGLTSGITKRMMPKYIGLTVAETQWRMEALKDEMVAVVNEMYEGEVPKR